MITPPGARVVFRDDPETMQASIDCALYQWNCLCNEENKECKCKIKLKWSTNPRRFPNNPSTTLAYAWSARQAYNPDDCWLNCDESYILLNNTKPFHDDKDGFYKRFFYNTDDDVYRDLREDYSVINFCDVLAHESSKFCKLLEEIMIGEKQ